LHTPAYWHDRSPPASPAARYSAAATVAGLRLRGKSALCPTSTGHGQVSQSRFPLVLLLQASTHLPPHLRADFMQTRTRTGESLRTFFTHQDRRIDDGGRRTATSLKSSRRTSGLRSESRKRRCSGPTTGPSRSSLCRLQPCSPPNLRTPRSAEHLRRLHGEGFVEKDVVGAMQQLPVVRLPSGALRPFFSGR
jgi:hypothetical protein